MRLSASLALLLSASAASANPVDMFGFGSRGPAMAGAQVAAVDDASSNYYNPGALATLDNVRIDIGYQYANPSLKVNSFDLDVDSARGVASAIVLPGQLGAVKIALGAAMYLPDQYMVRTRSLQAGQPRFPLYDNRPQRYLLSANLAVLIGERLGLGGGVTYMSGSLGAVDLRGRIGFPDAADSDLTLGINMDVESVEYYQAGAWYRANSWLTLGVSYRGAFNLEIEQIVDVRGIVGSEGMEPVVENGYFLVAAAAQDLFQPMTLVGGFSALISPRVSVAFDVAWQRWSTYENPATDLLLELDLGKFNEQIDIPERVPYPELNFSDIVIPRVGVEVNLPSTPRASWTMRGGYSFEASPAPEQVGETNQIDNNKHTFSLGGGVELSDVTELIPLPFSLDAFAALTLLPERKHRKLSPVDPVGDYRSSGLVLQLGLGSRWRF